MKTRLLIFAGFIGTTVLCACSNEAVPSETLKELPADNFYLTELVDRGGSTLRIDCQGTRPQVTMIAPSTEAWFVPVKLRFQDAAADQAYRTATDTAIDEMDSWTFDDELKAYEVRWPTVLMDTLIIADRVFIELEPEDQTPYAMVFDMTDRAREKIQDCVNRNSERVDQELRRLGLGPYDKRPTLPNHVRPAVDEETLLALYDEFSLSVDKASKVLVPNITEAQESRLAELSAAGKGTAEPFSAVMSYFIEQYPENAAALEDFISGYGFDGRDQWMDVGDRFYVGLEAVRRERNAPGWLDSHHYISGQAWSELGSAEKDMTGLVAAMSDTELSYFQHNFETLTRK